MPGSHTRHGKFRYRIFLVYTLPMVLLMSAFVILSAVSAQTKALDDYISYRQTLSGQLLSNLESKLGWLERQGRLLYSSPNTLTTLLAGPQRPGYYAARSEIQSLLATQMWINDIVDGIAILDTSGNAVYQWNRGNTTVRLYNSGADEWFSKTLALGGETLLRAGHRNLFSREDRLVVSYSRAIYTSLSPKPTAVVVVYQYLTRLDEYCDSTVRNDEQLILTDGEGTVLYVSDGAVPGITPTLGEPFVPPEEDKTQAVCVSTKSELLGWTLSAYALPTAFAPKDTLFSNLNFLLLFAVVCVSFLLSSILAFFVTKPLQQFAKSFERVEAGDLDAPVNLRGNDELAIIGQAYNRMLEQVRALIRERYELRMAKTQSELEALQSQINPHFLFNTLNSIQAVINTGDAERSGTMIQALSGLLRYSLGHGQSLVPFREELNNAKQYLYLQQCRYADRYIVRYDIDPAAMELSIPRLTLQPLLENAIRHGLEKQEGQGELLLTARRAGERFIIYVSNTGPSIPPERLAELEAKLSASTPDDAALSERVGILNIHHRLQLLYGAGFGLRISSQPPYTTVRLELPCRAAETREETDVRTEPNRAESGQYKG